MPPKIAFIGKPEDWLRRAKGNLARAKQTKPKDAFWEDLCFDAQQAAEKAIKAVLVFRQLEFRKTHDLRGILTLLDSSGYRVPEEIRRADELTDYAVETRYPGLSEPVSVTEYRDAVDLAQAVVRWAVEEIKPRKKRKKKS
jgi:HEPN domain-containing protein